MSEPKTLADLQTGDTAWYRGKDGTIYEVRIAVIGKAGPRAMPAWVHVLWTDIDGGMIVPHPERDLMAQDPRPAPEPEALPVVEVAEPAKRTRSRARPAATAGT